MCTETQCRHFIKIFLKVTDGWSEGIRDGSSQKFSRGIDVPAGSWESGKAVRRRFKYYLRAEEAKLLAEEEGVRMEARR